MSAAYFIGDRCRAYNDDYMKCKDEANGRGEMECLKEGRKVTRCAASVYVFLLFLPRVATNDTNERVEAGVRERERMEESMLMILTGSRISTPTA